MLEKERQVGQAEVALNLLQYYQLLRMKGNRPPCPPSSAWLSGDPRLNWG